MTLAGLYRFFEDVKAAEAGEAAPPRHSAAGRARALAATSDRELDRLGV